MTEMIFIIFRENDNVIDITLCILLVRFKNLVHVPLHMAWTVAVSHKGDIPNFLSAMGNDSEFPTVFVCNLRKSTTGHPRPLFQTTNTGHPIGLVPSDTDNLPSFLARSKTSSITS